MKSKKFIVLTIAIILIALVSAYSPPSNMDGRNYYSIYNFTNISADIFYQNGTQVLSSGDAINWTDLQNYPTGCSATQGVRIINDTLTCVSTINQSLYWDNETSQSDLNVNESNYWDKLNTPGDIQISDLDQTGETDLNVNKSNYWDTLGSPADFVDDSINESVISMKISCAAGNHLYVSGNDFACEPDDDTTYTNASFNVEQIPGNMSCTRVNGSASNLCTLTNSTYDSDETFINQLNEVFTWNNTYGFSNANVNRSNYWDGLNTPADIAISDLDQTGETDLNVNKSNFWDTYDVASELVDTHNHSNITVQSLDWIKLQTYPTACPGGTWVTTNADSNTCTAPTAADVEPGTFPAGNYGFQGNTSHGDNEKDCYGDSDDVCQYWNGSAFIIE